MAKDSLELVKAGHSRERPRSVSFASDSDREQAMMGNASSEGDDDICINERTV